MVLGESNISDTKEVRKRIPANVVIVEDEKDLCYLLALLLKKQNMSTACANSIAEARQTLKSLKPKLLFVDNHLPDGSGIDFIMEIRSVFPEMKIVMITAYDTTPDIENAFKKGADYFISKPFTARTIEKLLANYQLEYTF